MKNFLTLLVIISISIFTFSCSDDKSDNSEPDYISSSYNELTFISKGETKEITISSNTDWYIENESTWCHTSVTEGKNTQTILIYVEANEENQERKTDLKIKTKNKEITPCTISIIQEKKGVRGKISFTVKSMDAQAITWKITFRDLNTRSEPFDTLSFPAAKEVSIDWGDGSVEYFPTKYEITHKYAKTGTHTITIEGEDIYCCYIGSFYDLKPIPEIPNNSVIKANIQCSTLEAIGISASANGNISNEPEYSCPIVDFSECPNLKYIEIYAPIQKINISNCKELKILHALRNKFSDIDLSNNTKLIYCNLYMTNCTSIDLSSCTLLETLDCGYSSQLSSIDISKCPALTSIDCYFCNNLTSIDISNNKKLNYINIYNCNFNTIELNKLYQNLPQGKTWTNKDGSIEQSSIRIGKYIGIMPDSDIKIAEDKGWKVYQR